MSSKSSKAAKGNQQTAPAKKKGAPKRAARVVRGKENRAEAQLDPRAFWSPFLHLEAPPLRTSFGNFSTLNLVTRFTATSATGGDTLLFVPYSPSPLAAMTVYPGYSPGQHIYGPVSSGGPLATRPLRMGLEIRNITTMMNCGGLVQVLSVDNALATVFTLGTTSSSAAFMTSATITSLFSLVNAAEETRSYTAEELLQGHSFISVPAAWPEYNSYNDFIAFSNAVENSSIASGDVWALNQSGNAPAPAFPGAGDIGIAASWGDVPAMRGFLVVFKASPLANTYEITCRRQDGARYAANTLGHMFHQTPKQATLQHEDHMIATAKTISQNPSNGYISSLMDKAATIMSGLGHAALDSAGYALHDQFFTTRNAGALTRSMGRLALTV